MVFGKAKSKTPSRESSQLEENSSLISESKKLVLDFARSRNAFISCYLGITFQVLDI